MSQDSIDLEYSQGDSYQFCVLSAEEVGKRMKNVIEDANAVLQLPTTTMMVLLNHFGWDKEKLMEYYYDTDQEKLFKKAGVVDTNSSKLDNQQPQPAKRRRRIEECPICCNEFSSSNMYGMDCDHRFCHRCWKDYFTTKIMDEGIGQMISCMGHNCQVLVDDATVMKRIKEPKVKQRYQQLITNSFVQASRFMKWCPSRGCTNAIQVEYTDCQPVTCSCGHVFCFQCAEENHQPLKCNLLKKWLKKCSDDSETANWIVANTKDCPKCKTPIEKNGGCNHMICKKSSCNTEFCWSCLGLWSLHTGRTGYQCNSFDANAGQREKSRSALQRYFFYCDRYMNHLRSLKMEDKLYASVEQKMEEMQEHGISWVEAQFLKTAVDILRGCRKTLMYTYAFAFYLDKNNESTIFEDNQRDLESATETLSEYLEREITSEAMEDIKVKVQDKYRYCEGRRKVLLKHVLEGYQNDSWVYNNESA